MYCKFVYLAERVKRTGELTFAIDVNSPIDQHLVQNIHELKKELLLSDCNNLEEVVSLIREKTDFLSEIIDQYFIDKILYAKSEFNIPVIGDSKSLAEMLVTIINGISFKDAHTFQYNIPNQIYLYAMMESLRKFIELDFEPWRDSSNYDFNLLLKSVMDTYKKEKSNLTLSQITSLIYLSREFSSKILGKDFSKLLLHLLASTEKALLQLQTYTIIRK